MLTTALTTCRSCGSCWDEEGEEVAEAGIRVRVSWQVLHDPVYVVRQGSHDLD